ncbi:MAG: S8 family serine peptidase [Prolixibacteraceae bacterium]|nr:S8 family serine peptidase [Prolixibacteraceae bacterium]
MKRIFYSVLLAGLQFLCIPIHGQNYYCVSFNNKHNTPWSISHPEEFLSERALERRDRQNIAIDSLDLPVDPDYINQVLNLGCTFITSSKWLNGITVKTDIENFGEMAAKLPFVKEVLLTKRTLTMKSSSDKFADPVAPDQIYEIDTTVYGSSAFQISQLNGQTLHNQGFRGKNIHIAVLDAGFYKADQYPAFDSLWVNGRILGIKDFVNPESDFFEGHYHGMSVLSIMGGNIPGKLIGTAPEASYWLLRTEDISSEFIIEEDYWIAGAEFADSVGADIINSSLGYFLFDDPAMNHTYSEMDGKTTRVTRAANIAASRGMLVFASAGNEGSVNWKYIIAPSDGDSVIAVGAVNKEGVTAPFTSSGPASDGDVKPNVVAVGWNTVIQKSDKTVGTGNGTSYSAPVLAGMTACLWQANLHAGAFQVKSAIEKSAHLYTNPDSLLGYGIPDIRMAGQILIDPLFKHQAKESNWIAYPNPAKNYLVLQNRSKTNTGNIRISFYSLEGKMVYREIRPDDSRIVLRNLHMLRPGLFIVQIVSEDIIENIKIKKIP